MVPSPLPPPTLDSLAFDTSRYRYEGEDGHERVWFTPEEDRLSLSFFFKPPDLPGGSRHIFELLAWYERHMVSDTLKLVEFDIPFIDGTPAVWIVFKIPQQPSGMIYLGSLTVPFERCSYVLKLQCNERGVTGLRDMAAFLKAKGDGTITIGEDGQVHGEFNADDSRLDKAFPDHPLSRLNREFRALQPTIRLHADLKQEIPFPLVKKHVT